MKKKFGEIAVEQELITAEELEELLDIQDKLRKEGNTPEETLLGQLLFKEGFLNEAMLKEVLELQEKDLNQTTFSIKMLDSLQEENRYERIETLGEGGMGVVHLVKDTVLGREVALKKIKLTEQEISTLTEKQKFMLWRLNKEASITAILEHPNIVPLYEMQQKKTKEIHFTMRKVEGDTLRKFLLKMREERIEKDENKLMSIFSKVCDAIAYAHSKGIIHRDLKPENIMVGEFGEVYLMDWGIAKRVDEKINTSEKKTKGFLESSIDEKSFYKTLGKMGTEGYMSPEQKKDASQVVFQSDIYALGKILKEIFTLVSPLEELQQTLLKTPLSYLRKNVIKTKTIRKKHQKIPKDIQAIVNKAAANNIQERYFSVKELQKDVENYQKDMKVSVRDYSLFEVLGKIIRRNKQRVLTTCFLSFWGMVYISYSEWSAYLDFQKFMNDAKKSLQLSVQIDGDGKQQVRKKIELLLDTFNSLNKALSLKPGKDEPKFLKQKTGMTLLDLCYLVQDYELAKFVAKELQTLSIFSEEKEQSLIHEVEAEQNKVLKQHLSKFDEIEKRFRSHKQEAEESEDVIFEISKMQEEEILERLLRILKEGTKYFLGDAKTSTQNQFYEVMVNALGRLENPKAEKLLTESIKKMEQKLSPLLEKERPVSDLNFMVLIANALANLKITKSIRTLHQIRWKMGQHGYFSRKTMLSYRKLLLLIPLDNSSLPNFNTYNDRAIAKEEIGDFEGAIKDFEQAIKLAPDKFELYHNRGMIRIDIGDFEGAIADFDQFIKFNPKSEVAYNNRGNAKQKKGDFEDAIRDFDQAIFLNPRNPLAYHNRGITKKNNNDLNGAIADFDFALVLDPNFVITYFYRGLAKKAKNDLEGTLKDVNKAIELDDKFIDAFYLRGMIKQLVGNFEDAISDYDKTIVLDPKHFNAYSSKGVIKKNQGDLNGAIAEFDQAILLNPQDPINYLNRGGAKQEQGNLEDALTDYDQAIELNPKFAEAYSERGSTKRIMGKLDNAIADCSKAIDLNSKNAVFYNNRANAKKDKGDFEGALSDYSKAIEIDPQIAGFYVNRGNIKKDKKNLDGALSDYNLAIELNPQFDIAYYNRGTVKFSKGDMSSAVTDFSKTILINPKNINAYLNRAIVKESIGDLDGALVDYGEVLKLNPEHIGALKNRANTKNKKGDVIGAIEDFSQAIKLNPKDFKSYYDRGTLNALKGDLENALLDFNQALEINPKDANSYNNKGNIKDSQGDYDEAIKNYTLSLENDPKYENAYYNRGNSKKKKRDFEGAISDYTQCLNLNPQYVTAYFDRGIAKHKTGDMQGAIQDYNQTLKLNPKYFFAFYNLGLIYNGLGDIDKSIDAFLNALQIKSSPQAVDFLIPMLLERAILKYRKKEFDATKEDLLLLQKYAPKEHAKLKQVEKMLEQIGKQINQEK